MDLPELLVLHAVACEDEKTGKYNALKIGWQVDREAGRQRGR